MHPLSTALLLLGYGLALPIGMKLASVAATQHRVAMLGHQAGVLIALVGWLLRGSVILAMFHALWLAVARLWFYLARPEPTT